MNPASPAPRTSTKLAIALALTAASDFLLFHGYLGLSLFLFALLLAIAIIAANPAAIRQRSAVIAIALAAAGIAPLLETISALSISIALVSLSALALFLSHRLRSGIGDAAGRIVLLVLGSPLRLPGDLRRWRRTRKRSGRIVLKAASILVWAMPLVLGLVFIALFGLANPVVSYWISLIDPWVLLDLLDIWRILFWLMVLAGVWALLRPRLPGLFRAIKLRSSSDAPKAKPVPLVTLGELIFSDAAILRSLVVFNLLFGAETVLDAAYLWGGVALPDGLTYASYAHRGAYPLIVSALLAAAFVLVAMRPDSTTAANRAIRGLVYLWTAQNVVLVASSILRLDLYVSIYSLTYWRVAAFIWMLLVAAGLILIMARIALGRSNQWLLSANLLTLSATLYACAFINFGETIADYNVAHSREMGGGGENLDTDYLISLGPAAIPAIDRTVAGVDMPLQAYAVHNYLEWHHSLAMSEWRAWTFRGWRLSNYLAGHPAPDPTRVDSPDGPAGRAHE